MRKSCFVSPWWLPPRKSTALHAVTGIKWDFCEACFIASLLSIVTVKIEGGHFTTGCGHVSKEKYMQLHIVLSYPCYDFVETPWRSHDVTVMFSFNSSIQFITKKLKNKFTILCTELKDLAEFFYCIHCMNENACIGEWHMLAPLISQYHVYDYRKRRTF